MAAWKNPENFALWLTIVLVIVIALVSIFILFTRLYFMRIIQEEQKLQATILAHQKQLLEDSILVQERERRRIAADLHDDLIAKLNIALLSLHTTTDIQQSSEMLQKSISLARNISHDLSPPLLEKSSLLELITDFITPLQKTYNTHVYTTEYHEFNINNATKLQIFRITQEIINNILKHAQATKIDIYLRLNAQYIALKIMDNGIGFNDANIDGLGLKNIALRSQVLGGKFKFKSSKNTGTSFLFLLKK